MEKLSKYRKELIISLIALAHLVVVHFADNNIFTASFSSNPSDYIICKIIAFIVLWFFYDMLYLTFIDKNKKNNTIRRVLITGLPYLVIILGVTAIKLRSGFLSNDESLIYQNAISLTHYTWFYYITTFYYIVSLMIIPHMYAPIFIKLVIEYIAVGYTVLRCSDYIKSKSNDNLFNKPLKIPYGIIMFVLFILYPVIAYTTSAHRLPIYFLLYLILVVTLLFDKLEKKSLTYGKGFAIILLGTVLTQWRTEGIYLAVLVPILMLFAYENIRNKKSVIILIASVLITQYVVSIPQNGLIASEMGAAADDRMKPFYAYTITNMYRNGLDMDKNSADLEVVDKYISLDSLAAINEYYGDINYEDVLILYQPDFIGVREDADVTEYYNFVAALKNIFKNNPEVFVKTRIGAFKYAALPFHISFTGTSPKQLVSLAVSIVKTVSYNLFIPLIIVIVLCLFSLIKKRWFTFFLMGGLLAHWFIVFVLAPASYFKYYFPVYITAYLYFILIIIQFIFNKKHSVKLNFLR